MDRKSESHLASFINQHKNIMNKNPSEQSSPIGAAAENNTVSTSESSVQAPGKYLRRLDTLELEIDTYKKKCDILERKCRGLEQWRKGVEDWLFEAFAVTLDIPEDGSEDRTVKSVKAEEYELGNVQNQIGVKGNNTQEGSSNSTSSTYKVPESVNGCSVKVCNVPGKTSVGLKSGTSLEPSASASSTHSNLNSVDTFVNANIDRSAEMMQALTTLKKPSSTSKYLRKEKETDFDSASKRSTCSIPIGNKGVVLQIERKESTSISQTTTNRRSQSPKKVKINNDRNETPVVMISQVDPYASSNPNHRLRSRSPRKINNDGLETSVVTTFQAEQYATSNPNPTRLCKKINSDGLGTSVVTTSHTQPLASSTPISNPSHRKQSLGKVNNGSLETSGVFETVQNDCDNVTPNNNNNNGNEEEDDEISIVFSSPTIKERSSKMSKKTELGEKELSQYQETNAADKNGNSESLTMSTAIVSSSTPEIVDTMNVSDLNENDGIDINDFLLVESNDTTPCAVCTGTDPEHGNEMVFCDICNLCVHQVCYGVHPIPAGGWKCNPCRQGLDPSQIKCYFCPLTGSALKPVKSPAKIHWAHLSCALWIPEVKLENDRMMEPIIGVNKIPVARWKLKCSLCKVPTGACIQCQFTKRCAVAFHVTCAMKHGLEMKQIVDEQVSTGFSLQAFCKTHTYRKTTKSSNKKKKTTTTNSPNKRQRRDIDPLENHKSGNEQSEISIFNQNGNDDFLQDSEI